VGLATWGIIGGYVNELQRTYRGKAWRDARPAERSDVERAVVVASLDGSADDQDDRMAEFGELLRTAGAVPVATIVQRRDRPVPRTYLGRGKLEELSAMVEREKPDLVAAEGSLTAGQQRQLEDRLKIRVVDRTAVILDIFAQHAHTAEGKLQVELAQLEYSYSRQEGLWQHLERLGGGVGTRGPGETQLESDRRLLRNRMATLRRRLKDVARSRETQRARRAASAIPRVALTGYTNAGKSSLMNALTGAGVSVDDALFETLDPTTRRVELDGHEVLLSDTVGFIRHLPHQLVKAFSATLEEVRDADLILHVADASEPEPRRAAQARAVAEVLDEIGAAEVPRLLVLNKIDLVGPDDRRALANRHPDAVQVSATTREGLDALAERLAEAARARLTPVELTIPYAQSGLIATVYSDGREVEQEPTEDGTRVRALMPPAAAARLQATLENGAGPG
jgi:GTP-binding protein HflX